MTEATQNPEEWFLSQLEASEPPAEDLLRFLREHAEKKQKQAEAWAELLFDTLVEAGAVRDAIDVLALRAKWAGSSAASSLHSAARQATQSLRDKSVVVGESGFDRGLPPFESIRRVALLLDLEKGRLCYDKTWGFGIVKRVDYFYKEVEIDFDRKAAHPMAFSYAAESLELIGEDHILARRHNEPDEIKALIADDPAEIVRICIRSYGPLPVPALQEKIVPSLVPEARWKKFWDQARKDLKQDPLVEIPSKRTKPLRLLKKAKAFDADWFKKLSTERDLVTLLRRMEEFSQDPDAVALATEYAEVLNNRLAFVVKGAEPRFPGQTARAAMVAVNLGADLDALGPEAKASRFMDPDTFQDTMRQLPARLQRPFVEHLRASEEEATLAMLVSLLPTLEMGPLNVAVDTLLAAGQENVCADNFRQLVADMEAGIEVLNWILRNQDRAGRWKLGSEPELAFQALAQIEEDAAGERLRAQNALRERFSQPEWFQSALDAMTSSQRFDFSSRLKDTPGFPPMDRRSLLGRAIKRYGELQAVTAVGAASAETRARAMRITSPRSHQARQAQLAHLVNVEIPENSKEIGIARSYGDLRENHEYKAAKEMQGILLRRQGELEGMLSAVKPSDMSSLPHDRVGIATRVVLEYAEGHKETYHILGEWDRDEDLHIISCTTRMAKALEGHTAGEEVTVPAESGELTCHLVEVGPLPDEVRAWIDAEEAQPSNG